jgi:hypothetical protein
VSKTKCYPHVTGIYGDQGENPSALAIHAVLDPSPNYPENGRIIVGSPATTPTIPGYIPNLGGFNGGPAAIERLASTLLEAARDVRAAMGSGDDTRAIDDPGAPAMRLVDLDDLERKARAAESDEWQWRPANGDILEGKHNAQIVLAGEDLTCSVSDRAHIAAASPPVVLALIARIRELETAARDVADAPHRHAQQQRIGILRAVLGKGARRVGRPSNEPTGLETIAKAATAFVDRQGVWVAGGGLAQAADFCGDLFADLVRAVEGAGR